MRLDSTPRMLADPVSGFFAGINSTFARILIGVAGVVVGFALCYFSASGGDLDAVDLNPLGIFMIFEWADYGIGFVVGLAAMISIFYCLWAFVNDSNGKLLFFLIFTSATIYFFPVVFSARPYPEYDDENNVVNWAFIWAIVRAVGVYATLAVCYWVLPRVVAAFANRNEVESVPEQDENEPAISADEHNSGADSHEPDA